MTVISFGQGQPSTILSGVGELAAVGMWPLAVLVFFASITVPVLKLIGMAWLIITTRQGSTTHLRERTIIYHILDFIGRWSMIDVFMVSILTALVRMGNIASVFPGPGILSFCGVVILTMIAAMCFDPRLMWDSVERRRA
jgi:paraquat-inducible protein A